MGLSLTRRVGEPVRVTAGGQTLWVTVTEIARGQVRVAFDGPLSFGVDRDETLPAGERHAAVTRPRRLPEAR